MHWIDWCITVVPVVIILYMAIGSRKYVRGVVDYLAAGRVAGRYVIAVGGLEGSLSVVMLVALAEEKFQTGYALNFWWNIVAPLWLVLSLTGYCLYRFRETRSLSIGQFLEMRYNRPFRIFAATLRTTAEMLTNAIGPAIAANFFVYYLGLPHKVMILGVPVPCYALLVGLVLAMAVVVMWPGGRVALLITDCFQGLISYPIFVMMAGYVLLNFSWTEEISPVMLDRASGESFLNPFDIEKLRDFNIFALVVATIGSVLNRASWIGNDTSSSGRTPHEQKMAGILGAWRNGFSMLMCLLIAVAVITVMSHTNFAPKAKEIRRELAGHVAAEVVADPALRNELTRKIDALPEFRHQIGKDAPLSRNGNSETPLLTEAEQTLGGDGDGNYMYQKFKTLYHQMMMPVALRTMLPVGMTGVFCLLMIMLMLSTDDSRIFNSSATIVQDIILPLRKDAMTPRQHLLYLRIGSVCVALIFFVCSLFFVHLDYINMFITIMASVWLGGAGPVMVFGLYSRRGTTAGAFAAIFAGSGISIAGILVQRHWAAHVYPLLDRMGWISPLDNFLRTVSGPFEPYISWQMDAIKFPINSMEIYFFSMMAGVGAYWICSLLTCREPYNLERLLHRGIYSADGTQRLSERWSWSTLCSKIVGITPEYTRTDRWIAWSVFYYSFVFQFLICFVLVLVWNILDPWPDLWWSHYFLITTLWVGIVTGIISTVWFMWGGVRDMRNLFRDLALRTDNPLDDGRVEGNVSVADQELLTTRSDKS